MRVSRFQPWWLDSRNRASGGGGAVHLTIAGLIVSVVYAFKAKNRQE
jgi:hypothetical protein